MALPYQFSAKTIIQERGIDQTVLEEIKNWLHTTSLPDLQDELIVLFLLLCESDFTATQSTIQAHFRIKHRASDMFRNLDFESEGLTTSSNTITFCPMRGTVDRTLTVLCRFNDTNYRIFFVVDCMKLGFMLLDINQRCNPPDDLILVTDMKGITFMHLSCIKMSAMKNFIDYLQHGIPLKIKSIHILNVNYVAEKFVAITKLFMKSELAAALQTHPKSLTFEEFHRKWIPSSPLPKEYGGDLPSYEELHEKSISEFRKMKNFFEAEDKLISSYNPDS